MSNTLCSEAAALVDGVFGVTFSDESTVGGASLSADFGELESCLVGLDASVSSDNPFKFPTTLAKFEILSDDDVSLPIY